MKPFKVYYLINGKKGKVGLTADSILDIKKQICECGHINYMPCSGNDDALKVFLFNDLTEVLSDSYLKTIRRNTCLLIIGRNTDPVGAKSKLSESLC